MSDGDWPIFRPRAHRGPPPSPVGRTAEFTSSSGLRATVRVLALDDACTTARVRHAFGEAWVPLVDLRLKS